MYALVSLLVVASLSLLVIRVGTVALEMTGLSRDVASFQSLSAFSGAGFTTEEAESALAYPARRRIVEALIRLGSVGVITAISSLVLSFTNPVARFERLLVLVAASLVLVSLARSERFDRMLTPAIERVLDRTTDIELHDYTGLLRLHREYRVADLSISEDDWLASAELAELDLPSEGVVVLGIRRADGTYVGAPSPSQEIRPGDTVIAYGREDRLRELAGRTADDESAHRDACDEHERLQEVERRLDPERGVGVSTD